MTLAAPDHAHPLGLGGGVSGRVLGWLGEATAVRGRRLGIGSQRGPPSGCKRTERARNGRNEAIRPAISTARAAPALTEQLIDMIPGAAKIRVTCYPLGTSWPHPKARALDADGRPIALNRAQSRAAATWIMRAYADADWDQVEPRELDLASGRLGLVGAAQVQGLVQPEGA